jgi:opacity protein-like surface antigen
MKYRGWLTFVLSVILLSSAPGFAQHYLGPIAGLNFTDLDMSTHAEGRTAFGFGGVYDFDFSEKLTLHIEGLYLRKGGLIDFPDPGPDVKLKSDYFELPILIKASFGNNIRPYFALGPSFGLLLASSIEAEIDGETYSATIQEITSGLDVGFTAGAGMDYYLGNKKIFVQARYTYSVNRMRVHGTALLEGGGQSEIINFADAYYKNKGMQVLAGVSFQLNTE